MSRAGRSGGRGSERGLTLVEVMIALVIGLVLTLGAAQIFISSNKGFRANDAVARIQENGRYALGFLTRDIRAAAFWGCAQEVEMNSTLNSGGGVNFNGPPLIGADAAGPDNSDTVTLRAATQNNRLQLQNTMPTTAAALIVNAHSGVEIGDILIVTDCEAADVFQVTNTKNTSSSIVHNSGDTGVSPGNYTQQLSRRYDTSATVYTAEEKTYSLGADANGNRALQRTVNGAATESLVSGVQDMQITYGEDFDNDETADAYLGADQVTDWGQVLSVRIELLMRSRDDNIVDAAQQYTYAGSTTTAGDRRMYQVYSRTIGVRNRLP